MLPALSLPAIQLIEAHLALGASLPITSLAGLLAKSGDPKQQRSHVVAVVETLATCGVAWSDDGVISHLASGFDKLVPSPLGLGPSMESNLTRTNVEDIKRTLRHLGLPRTGDRTTLEAKLRAFFLDGERIRAEVDSAPPDIRAAFTAQARGTAQKPVGFDGERYRIEQETQTWAQARGFLQRSADYTWVIPTQVRLALQGNDFRAPFEPIAPAVPVTTGSIERVNGEAGAAALEFLASTTMVLEHLARQPAAMSKDGGIGTREIGRIAKISRSDEARVRLILALARAHGLVVEKNSTATVSDYYPAWARTEPRIRISQLVAAWWRLGHNIAPEPKVTSPASALVRSVAAQRDCRALRQATLGALVKCGPHQELVDFDALTSRINWSHPVLVAGRSHAVQAILAQAQQLGVLGGTACGPMAFALSPLDDVALWNAARATLPAVATSATFGSDLTVLVSGTPAAEIGSLLDSCADRESAGNATVWRFSPSSVRRAFDGGSSAADLRSALADMADGPLPQTLTYLIADVGRRHGVVTVVAASCCLRSEDTSLLSQMCADRSLRRVGLQLIAPTVATSDLGIEETLAIVRAAGYLPAARGAFIDVVGGKSRSTPAKPASDRTADLGTVGLSSGRALRSRHGEPAESAERQRARAMAELRGRGQPAGW